MAEIVDYDKLRKDRPEKKFKLGGKVIDYSFIPAKISLDALKMYDDIDKDDPGEREIDRVFDIVMSVIKANNNDEELTKDWLLENADFSILMMEQGDVKGIIPLIVEQVNNIKSGEGEGKNAQKAQKQ